ncbi:MAG: glycoside hydrolase family 3 N-terminal domain-containing protein [Sedimentisphaerales bacterium]|nr:glycoside hydrolase family 3 N-terminal domain-containing protein [Sedimentisphaerales bacterium]
MVPNLICLVAAFIVAGQPMGIYHDGWIDLNKNGQKDPYEDPKLDIEKRVQDLLARMTIEEKTCQMATLYGYRRVLQDPLPTPEWDKQVWKDGIANIDEHLNGVGGHGLEFNTSPARHVEAINTVQRWFIEQTRLGIPVDFTNEGIRGLCCVGATCMPAQVGQASTWDPNLIARIGHVVGREARALGYTNIYAPILDLPRDPRWGRVIEAYSEDPFLTSALGVAMIEALQAEGVASTPKHYCIYSVPKGGRDGAARTDPHESLREVETIFMAPWRAAFMQAKAMGTMSSYNDYDGIPITGSYDFLTQRLRGQYGFKGYVVSDSDAVRFIFSKHRVAATYKDAVRQAVEAGLNVRTTFTPPEVFINPLRELIKEGSLPMDLIDRRVADVLRVKFWLGLFDNPYRDPAAADRIVHCSQHRQVALEAARKLLVLLKNEGHLLPLRKDIKSILVAGPNAQNDDICQDRYGPYNAKIITVLEGIKAIVPDANVVYFKGCDVKDRNWPTSEILPEPPDQQTRQQIQQAAQAAKACQVAIVVLGEDRSVVGEGKSRTSLDLPGHQLDLVKAIYATGTPTVVVLLNGRALSINWIDKYIPAILEAWAPGEYCGQAIAEALFGDINPGGKLPVTFPKAVGQIPFNFPYKPASQADETTTVNGPLYCFGHGLSYTTFEYSNLNISPTRQGPDGTIAISLDLTNTGSREGDEVVQLYIRDDVSSVITYDMMLKGFERVTLRPGQTRRVRFNIHARDLAILDKDYQWVVEPGTFTVMVGSSSEDIRLKGHFEIVK